MPCDAGTWVKAGRGFDVEELDEVVVAAVEDSRVNVWLDAVGEACELEMGASKALDIAAGVDVNAAWLEVFALLSLGDGGSSSSESELSPGEGTPVVDGLLPGESGLSGPSSSLPGPTAPRPASCRLADFARTCMGKG